MSQEATVEAIRRVTGVRMPQTTFSGYMRETEPPASIAGAIARFYNVSIEWMIGETEDRQPLPSALKRLSDLSFSRDVEKSAQLLMQLSEDERAEIVAMIAARYRQWETMNGLIEIVNRMDSTGTLAERIRDLSGIDIGSSKTRGQFVDNDLLSNGDLGCANEQLPLIAG